jgi:hypothetical protein
MVAAGVAKVRAAVIACGDAADLHGTLHVHVAVQPDGHVHSVEFEGEIPQVSDCVRRAFKGVTFSPTQHGGAFSQPFQL